MNVPTSPDVAHEGRSIRLKLAMVTNIPVPYREPVMERLAREADVDLKVFYCADREPNRNWQAAAHHYERQLLRERFLSVGGRYVHWNLDILPALKRFHPDVVVTTGFNPTHLLAFAYARLLGIPHVAMTDGTLESEQRLSAVHRGVRRIVYHGSRAFVGASEGSRLLYERYGIAASNFYKSVLCADIERFRPATAGGRSVDLLFCGRLVEDKSPLFALEVAQSTARLLHRRVSIAFAGNGPLESQIHAAAQAAIEDVDVRFLGFRQPDELPRVYADSRVFLFPSRWDPWGVVANEAAASGVPIIVSPHAGAADELVVHGRNGYVLPLELGPWAAAASRLLKDTELWARMSQAGRALAEHYTFDRAAAGIANACRAATSARDFVAG